MNRETMEYVSRRTRNEQRNEEMENRRGGQRNEYEENRRNEYSEYPVGQISRRYSTSNRYMENHMPNEGSDRQIGFVRNENYETKKSKDFIYEMEESLEMEIDDIVYYSELAMEAESKGHTEFSNGFYEIAKEKLACAEFIRLRLMKCGEYDPSKQKDIEERYDRAKHLFKRL